MMNCISVIFFIFKVTTKADLFLAWLVFYPRDFFFYVPKPRYSYVFLSVVFADSLVTLREVPRFL